MDEKMEYEIALFKRYCDSGLTKPDIIFLVNKLGDNKEVLPIEFYSKENEYVAVGFITVDAAWKLDYDYEKSGLLGYISSILEDMDNEHIDNHYIFNDIDIFLSYDEVITTVVHK